MGKKLSQRITKRVIMLVMIIMVATPFFTESMWISDFTSFEMGLQMVYDASNNAKGQTY